MKVENCTLLNSLMADGWAFRSDGNCMASALKKITGQQGIITLIKPVIKFSGETVDSNEFATAFKEAIEAHKRDEISKYKAKKEHPNVDFNQTMKLVNDEYENAFLLIDACTNADSTKFFQGMRKLGFQSGLLFKSGVYILNFMKSLRFNPGNVYIMMKVTKYPFDDDNLLQTFKDYIDYYERNKQSMINGVITKHPSYSSPEAAINEVIEVHNETYEALYKMMKE